MDEVKLIVAEWLGITPDQAEELKLRLHELKSDSSGFGNIKIDIKRSKVFRISHTLEGKPTLFKDIGKLDTDSEHVS